MSRFIPTIYELPMMEFGGGPVYLFADLPEGARVSWAEPGKLEVLNSAVLPVGMMLVVIAPERAARFRPLKVRKSPNPLELGASSFVRVGPIEIPVLVDVDRDLDATITRGVVMGGARLPVPEVPAFSLVCAIFPDLAQKIRPLVANAMRDVQRQMAQAEQSGSRLH